jgi:hypothetical protein
MKGKLTKRTKNISIKKHLGKKHLGKKHLGKKHLSKKHLGKKSRRRNVNSKKKTLRKNRKMRGGAEKGDECPLCLGGLITEAGEEQERLVRAHPSPDNLPPNQFDQASHVFHEDCLREAMESGHRNCPKCRTPITRPLQEVPVSALYRPGEQPDAGQGPDGGDGGGTTASPSGAGASGASGSSGAGASGASESSGERIRHQRDEISQEALLLQQQLLDEAAAALRARRAGASGAGASGAGDSNEGLPMDYETGTSPSSFASGHLVPVIGDEVTQNPLQLQAALSQPHQRGLFDIGVAGAVVHQHNALGGPRHLAGLTGVTANPHLAGGGYIRQAFIQRQLERGAEVQNPPAYARRMEIMRGIEERSLRGIPENIRHQLLHITETALQHYDADTPYAAIEITVDALIAIENTGVDVVNIEDEEGFIRDYTIFVQTMINHLNLGIAHTPEQAAQTAFTELRGS